MLTKKQYDLLLFIHNHSLENGVSPSFDEMKEALQLASKSGIHRLITALEERGFIRRLPNRARALEVLKLPQDSEAKRTPSLTRNNVFKIPVAANSQQSVSANTISSAARQAANDEGAQHNIDIPVMGRIAAGMPISAIQHQTNSLSLPPDMIGNGIHYALEVKGDSMINAGILDGDTVIIRESNTAIPGDVVVALVDDEEATLKYFRREKGMIALEAANPAYETRYFTPERVKVQGVLVSLMRRYH